MALELLTPYGPLSSPRSKMKIFNFELEEKLYQHFIIEFDGESNGDSPEAQKAYFDPKNDPYLQK